MESKQFLKETVYENVYLVFIDASGHSNVVRRNPSLEGIDGVGKTSCAATLYDKLAIDKNWITITRARDINTTCNDIIKTCKEILN